MLKIPLRAWTKKRLTLKYAAPLLLICLTSAPITSFAATADAAKGQAISAFCSGCHGADGIATNSSYPNLAGQNYQYLVNALQKYKLHQRNNGLMNGIASGLSAEQIKDLSAYYASVKVNECSPKNGTQNSQPK